MTTPQIKFLLLFSSVTNLVAACVTRDRFELMASFLCVIAYFVVRAIENASDKGWYD